MDLNQLCIPKEISASLDILKNDIEINQYSEKGGNGHIFFGFHKIFQKRVALKYYYSGEGLHQEVQLLKNIDNNYIIKVWDARTINNGWSYFITAEIKNGDLDELINKKENSLKKAVNLTRNILSGLGCMHSSPNNLLHRDLKPQNILLDRNISPKIADFGSVKRLAEDEDYVSGSQHAALYRPPESFFNSIYTYSSDIYQIGLIFYQLLGGELSYLPENLLSKRKLKHYKRLENDFEKSKFVDRYIADRANKAKLLSIDSLPLYCSDKIKRIIRKATKPNLEDRYQSTYEFLLSLQKLGSIPNWKTNSDGLISLNNWEGKDYKITKRKNNFVCEKNIKTGSGWRKDGSIKNGTLEEVINQLNSKIGWG